MNWFIIGQTNILGIPGPSCRYSGPYPSREEADKFLDETIRLAEAENRQSVPMVYSISERQETSSYFGVLGFTT